MHVLNFFGFFVDFCGGLQKRALDRQKRMHCICHPERSRRACPELVEGISNATRYASEGDPSASSG